MPEPKKETNNKSADKPTYEKVIPKDEAVETTHTVTIDGQAVSYKATAGTIVLKEDDGEPKAAIFFVANGYYDLATPYFATEYTFNHLALDSSLQGNIAMAYYEAGHMMYVHEPSLAKQADDLRTFIRSAV